MAPSNSVADRTSEQAPLEPARPVASLQSPALRALVAAVILNAAIAIWAVLAGDLSETAGRILASSFILTAAIVAVLANAIPWERRIVWPSPVVAIAAIGAAFVLVETLIWTSFDSTPVVKTFGSALTVAGAATLVDNVGLVPSSPRRQWLDRAHFGATVVAAVTIVIAIWAETDTAWMMRTIGVESIIVAALTLLVPIVARLDHLAPPPSPPGPRPSGG